MADIPPSTFRRDPDFGRNRVEPRRYGVGRYGVGRYSPSDPTRFAWARVKPAAIAFLLALFIAAPAAADTLTPGLNLIKISEDVEDPLRTWGSKEDENKNILDAAICDKRVGCTITGPLVVTGTFTAVNFISVSSVAVVAPLTGDGLIANPLGVDSSSVTLLGPTIGVGEIDAGAVTTSVLGLSAVTTPKINDDAVLRKHLSADTCTDGQILKLTGSSWECAADADSGATGWTDDGATVRLTTVGDNVGIGTASPDSKLHVVGGAITLGPTTGISHTDNIQMIIESADGATQSSGCLVSLFVQTIDAGDNLVFTSTTTASISAKLAVLAESCAPGAFCRVITHGLARITTAGAVALDSLRTHPTRCRGQSSAVAVDNGVWMTGGSAGEDVWVWIR